MPTLTLEPRDAGALVLEDLRVEFEDEMTRQDHAGNKCVTTCQAGGPTLFRCVPSIFG